MSTSAIVVNHNGGDMVLECLRALDASSDRPEIVVVDNASSDASPARIAEQFPHAKVVSSATNLGFGAGVNLGVRHASGGALVVVTSDTIVDPGAVSALRAMLGSQERAAAVGPLVRNPDGSIQPSKRAFPSVWHAALHGLLGLVRPDNPGTRAYTLADAPLDEPARVDWVSGSCMALRRTAFEAVGGFDEDYFFFVEDVDLCRRLTDSGWEIWFDPRAEVTHAWGGTWTRRPLKFIWLHHRNLFRYVTKHYRGAWVLAWPFIAAGLGVRLAAVSLRWALARRALPAHRESRRGTEASRSGRRGGEGTPGGNP